MSFTLRDPAFLAVTQGAGGVGEDPDAAAYLDAVEVADGQVLEAAVRVAINAFVVGCKADGIWAPIKASCILAGARTLGGALVPLVGAPPTNFNFVSGDYNRKTGLQGNGSSKYLNSNRAANADPTNSMHLVVFASNAYPINRRLVGAYSGAGTADDFLANSSVVNHLRCRSIPPATGLTIGSGFYGISRSTSTSFAIRTASTNYNGASTVASAPGSAPCYVFAQNNNGPAFEVANVRLQYYSIGQSINLALLDSRVSVLMTALNSAIP